MSAIHQQEIAWPGAGPAIYTADFMSSLVKQYEAALVKQEGTITEANAEIERLKSRISKGLPYRRPKDSKAWHSRTIIEMRLKEEDDLAEKMLKNKNVVKPEVKVEVIEDSDSDSDVVEVNMVVYNGVTYLRDSNSNVLYHPKSHEVIGMWNKDRGRVDAYPINHHEE
jgi:ribosomal protein S6